MRITPALLLVAAVSAHAGVAPRVSPSEITAPAAHSSTGSWNKWVPTGSSLFSGLSTMGSAIQGAVDKTNSAIHGAVNKTGSAIHGAVSSTENALEHAAASVQHAGSEASKRANARIHRASENVQRTGKRIAEFFNPWKAAHDQRKKDLAAYRAKIEAEVRKSVEAEVRKKVDEEVTKAVDDEVKKQEVVLNAANPLPEPPAAQPEPPKANPKARCRIVVAKDSPLASKAKRFEINPEAIKQVDDSLAASAPAAAAAPVEATSSAAPAEGPAKIATATMSALNSPQTIVLNVPGPSATSAAVTSATLVAICQA